MSKYQEFGATDTEPRFNFKNALFCKIVKQVDKIPQDAGDWELYSSMTGVGTAAKSMTARLTTLINSIPKTPYDEVQEVIRFYGLED